MNSYKSPKILFISNYNLSSDNATNITIRSFFDSVPKENIFVITEQSCSYNCFDKVLLSRKLFSGIRTLFKIILSKKNQDKGSVPSSLNCKDKKVNKKHIIFSAYSIFFSWKLSKRQLYKIDKYKPDIIYILGRANILKLGIKLAKRYNISTCHHIMDDWYNTIFTGSMLLKLPRAYDLFVFQKSFALSKINFAISPYASEEYSSRYNKKFQFLMNCISDKKLEYISRKKQIITGKLINISYFGGMHVGRWETLAAFAEVVNKINSASKVCKFSIYTSQENIDKYRENFKSSEVDFYSYIPHDQVLDKMIESDILLHIESFEQHVMKYTRLSISTKIPEYIACCKPIIAIGPADIGSMKYLDECGVALLITKNSTEYMASQIENYFIDDIASKVDIKKNLEIIRKNHNPNIFIQTLNKILR